MFAGNLKNWNRDKVRFPASFARALDYFFANGGKLPAGHHLIEGEALFVNIEDGLTKPASERRFEVHGHYADIQVLISGAERQDYALDAAEGVPEEDRMEKNDIAFYADPAETQSLLMKPGDYAVYFPGELHAPNLAVSAPADHLKAIFKIREDLF